MTVFKDVRTLVDDAIAAAVALKGETPAKTTGSYNNGKIDVPAKQSEVDHGDEGQRQGALIDSGLLPGHPNSPACRNGHCSSSPSGGVR
jgi:putative multiple sugar transport system substrate-binding protein